MEKEREYFVVTDEEGKEINCEIIMTFNSDEFAKSYVVYQVVGDETGEYFAASYNPDDGDEGKLGQIESEAEWDFVEEVLESYLDDLEDEAEEADVDEEADTVEDDEEDHDHHEHEPEEE
ncbi:MAG: DUF1292 domain-containing protein [bacterium]